MKKKRKIKLLNDPESFAKKKESPLTLAFVRGKQELNGSVTLVNTRGKEETRKAWNSDNLPELSYLRKLNGNGNGNIWLNPLLEGEGLKYIQELEKKKSKLKDPIDMSKPGDLLERLKDFNQFLEEIISKYIKNPSRAVLTINSEAELILKATEKLLKATEKFSELNFTKDWEEELTEAELVSKNLGKVILSLKVGEAKYYVEGKKVPLTRNELRKLKKAREEVLEKIRQKQVYKLDSKPEKKGGFLQTFFSDLKIRNWIRWSNPN